MIAKDSKLGFTFIQDGKEQSGHFQNFSADIQFDPANPAGSRVIVTIPVASAETGSDDRDTTLVNADWFAAGTHPEARFESTAFSTTGDQNAYYAEGELTIRGTAQSVSFPFTLTQEGRRATARGALTINRRDFGIGVGTWAGENIVAPEVGIHFIITAERADGRLNTDTPIQQERIHGTTR